MNMAPPPVKVSQIAGQAPPCCQPDMRHTVPVERGIMANPRHSAGSLVLGQSPPRYAAGPPSPTDSDCSCDSSMPLNTPWSSPPTSNSGSMVSRSRRRRSSVADAPRPILRGGRAPSPPRPLVVQKPRAPSPIRSERNTTARTIIVPASSGSTSSHRSSSSRSYAKYSSSARSEKSSRAYYDAYAKSVDVVKDQQAGHDFPRPGRTKFPRKLVDREAVEEMNYPYTIEDGCVVVMQALGRPEIEALVDLTEELRRRGDKKRERKAVSFYEKTIVHEALPIAPTPPASDIMSIASHEEYPHARVYHPNGSHLTQPNVSHLNSSSGPILVPASSNPSARARSVYNPASSRSSGTIIVPASSNGSSRARSVYNPGGPTYMSGALPPPTFEPLSPPGPSTPKPTAKKIEFETPAITIPGGKTAEEKIARVEEKAIKADKIAAAKEYKAQRTGRAKDEHEAWKARNKAEDLVKKLEEKERKERLKQEGRELKERAERERSTVHVGRNRRGEVVVIKG